MTLVHILIDSHFCLCYCINDPSATGATSPLGDACRAPLPGIGREKDFTLKMEANMNTRMLVIGTSVALVRIF